jgi:hypothetical protein
MDVTVSELAKRVQQPPSFIKRRGDVTLRTLFAQFAKSPHGVSDEEKRRITPTEQAIDRLNKHLDAFFLTDRACWYQQVRLFVDRSEQGKWILKVGPLSHIIASNCLKFWFWQCQRLPKPHDARNTIPNSSANKKKETVIVVAEPLVFYSHNLRGYIRLLDVNSDKRLDEPEIAQRNREARESLRKRIASNSQLSVAQKFVDSIGLEAARAYIPAGDSNAARRIRRWFRITRFVEHEVDYKEISDVSPSDYDETNLIVLASRSSNTLLQQFQERNSLHVKLNETGITIDGKPYRDEVDEKGYHRAFVIVTNWTFKSGAVHSYLASNHTRALDKVAELLVAEESGKLKDMVELLIDANDEIAERFQFVFDVELEQNETRANEPALFTGSGASVFIYHGKAERLVVGR